MEGLTRRMYGRSDLVEDCEINTPVGCIGDYGIELIQIPHNVEKFRHAVEQAADAITEWFRLIGSAFDLFVSLEQAVDLELEPYATPRQWHLYKHGKRRVRKKWGAELWRRYHREDHERQDFDCLPSREAG